MRDAVKDIVPSLRSFGFKGSGKTYRKSEADFVFVINFQASRSGDVFYVNLGAQPTFAPAEGHADLLKLKEYECILRRRVGQHWPPKMNDADFAAFQAQLVEAQEAFFGHARKLPEAVATQSPETLLHHYCSGTTLARSTLHLARAAANLGHHAKAHELAQRGLEVSGDGATMLRAELEEVLASLPKPPGAQAAPQ